MEKGVDMKRVFGIIGVFCLAAMAQDETVLFDQGGEGTWLEPSYAAASSFYRMTAEDFAISQQAQITKIDVYGGYVQTRGQAVQKVELTIYSDNDGLPGSVLYSQVFDDPDPNLDGMMRLVPADCELRAGTYWLNIFEKFTSSQNLPTPWSWSARAGRTFGQEYVITMGEGSGPGAWMYGTDFWNGEYPEGRLMFRVLGIVKDTSVTPPAPDFITATDLWIGDGNRVFMRLPHPNADGWDGSNRLLMSYRVAMVQDCEVLFEGDVQASNFPAVYSFPIRTPDEPYEVEVYRRVHDVKRDSVSSPTVIVGPAVTGDPSVIPSDFWELKRWVLHVPKVGGGFQGKLVLNNRFPSVPSEIWIAGFDVAGRYLEGTQKKLVVIGPLGTIPIYPYDGESQSVFEAALTDSVSHIGLFEVGGARHVHVSISYKQFDNEDAFPAAVEETDLDTGLNAGSVFTVEGRRGTGFWDGVAVLNLRAALAQDVDIVYRELNSGDELGRITLDSIQPGHKKLAVLSDLFPYREDTYYTVESKSPGATIQVLGLRGSYATPILVGSSVHKMK